MWCSLDGGSAELSQEEQARATVNTAVHQLRGDLTGKPDEKAAFHTMLKAAAMEYGPAETRLGEFYLQGIGTSVDPAKAAELFDRAAFHGDAEGEYALGSLYSVGLGVAQDQAMAIKLFTRAAQKDVKEAEYALGFASETGVGVAQDMSQAVKWYRKSAEQGYALAEEKLAKMYWNGDAGKQDRVTALEWAILAEKQGTKQASNDVQQFRAALSVEQIAEAEKRAERFKVRVAKPKQ